MFCFLTIHVIEWGIIRVCDISETCMRMSFDETLCMLWVWCWWLNDQGHQSCKSIVTSLLFGIGLTSSRLLPEWEYGPSATHIRLTINIVSQNCIIITVRYAILFFERVVVLFIALTDDTWFVFCQRSNSAEWSKSQYTPPTPTRRNCFVASRRRCVWIRN